MVPCPNYTESMEREYRDVLEGVALKGLGRESVDFSTTSNRVLSTNFISSALAVGIISPPKTPSEFDYYAGNVRDPVEMLCLGVYMETEGRGRAGRVGSGSSLIDRANGMDAMGKLKGSQIGARPMRIVVDNLIRALY
eukprot:CAMPEP_0118658062 /NCGR_PEP_ID=MMETSP0785-20121206/14361_1 /TAXON_ID=91992 /ORGANISM="Bolidomonas pacifica, Strain CCMP 1866" /LENGTH=137 /DNA_ID=CAMNT_0006551041 /DNA_START=792 /DNA_END=1202 /DNA_ORIENTATION=-